MDGKRSLDAYLLVVVGAGKDCWLHLIKPCRPLLVVGGCLRLQHECAMALVAWWELVVDSVFSLLKRGTERER